MNAKKRAALTALHATGHSVIDVGEKNKEGRHVGLDFYDLLIEALKIPSPMDLWVEERKRLFVNRSWLLDFPIGSDV